jgi:hypothetical protein
MSSSSTVQLKTLINHENLYDLHYTMSPLHSDTVEGPASNSTCVGVRDSWDLR